MLMKMPATRKQKRLVERLGRVLLRQCWRGAWPAAKTYRRNAAYRRAVVAMPGHLRRRVFRIRAVAGG